MPGGGRGGDAGPMLAGGSKGKGIWGPLVSWRANTLTREEAVDAITQKYAEFADTFEVHAQAA